MLVKHGGDCKQGQRERTAAAELTGRGWGEEGTGCHRGDQSQTRDPVMKRDYGVLKDNTDRGEK